MTGKASDGPAAKTRLPGSASARAQFEFRVFPDELEYVADRRQAHELPFEDSGVDKPTTRHGLIGLAFSGGGIRSATFNLGVAQAFHRWGLFKRFDLMSTVSGGGFVGSGITSMMSQEGEESPAEFPFSPNPFGGERPTVVHLRNNSNYLAPKGPIDYIRMFAVLVRGVILNFLVLVPFLLVPCMIITLFYGTQLLDRLEYDQKVERTVALMRTALDRSNAAADDQGDQILVAEKRPVKPFLELLKSQAFLPPDLVRNDEPVADALRVRSSAFRDVKDPLATGSANQFSPLTFLPEVDLQKVAKRLIDADLLMDPETVEEIWVAEQVLQSTSPELADKRSAKPRRGSRAGQQERPVAGLGAMRQKLRPNLRTDVAAARDASGRRPLFMPFVTEESLLEALRIAQLVEAEPLQEGQVECKGGTAPLGGRCWSFKSPEKSLVESGLSKEEKAKAAAQRAERQRARRWMQVTQAFYDQRLFDPEALKHHLARTGVERALAYSWPDGAPGHEEIERAANRLWEDVGGRPTVGGLFAAAERARQAGSSAHKRKGRREREGKVADKRKPRKRSPSERAVGGRAGSLAKDSLLAKDLEDRGEELFTALAGAGLLVKDKHTCPARGEGDWAARTAECKWVDGQLHRLPGFLFEREFFEPTWFQPKVRPSFWSLERWRGPPPTRYGRVISQEDRLEVEAARAELALRPGTVREVMNQLARAARPPASATVSSRTAPPGRVGPLPGSIKAATSRPALIDARGWEPRMDSTPPGEDLPRSLLEALEEENLVRCDGSGLETCHFASRQSVYAIPGLLYRHHFYDRQWFIRYFAVPKPVEPPWLEEHRLDDKQKKQAWKILRKSILEWRADLEGDVDERVTETIGELRAALGANDESPQDSGLEPAVPASAGPEPVVSASAEPEPAMPASGGGDPVPPARPELADRISFAGIEEDLRALLKKERENAHLVAYRARWERVWTVKRDEILVAAREQGGAGAISRSPAALIVGLETLLEEGTNEAIGGAGEAVAGRGGRRVNRRVQKEINGLFKKIQAAGHFAPSCKYKNQVNKDCRFANGSNLDRTVQWMLQEGHLEGVRAAGLAGVAKSRVSPVGRAYEALVRGYFLEPNWNPRQLHLPFTQFVAISGLVLVLLFPLLTLVSKTVPTGGSPASGRFRRGLDRLLTLIARVAAFFRRDRSFSWFMVFIAAAAFLDLQPYLIYHWHHLDLGADWSMALSAVSIATAVIAGPALSFFKKFGRTLVIAAVSLLGPLLPFVVYLSLLNELIYDERWPTRAGYDLQEVAVVLFFLLAALLVHLFLLTLNPNSTGMHNFYKDRLADAYLLGDTARGDVESGQDRPLSEICPDGSGSPYHLLNVSLNLQASDDPEVRDRNSDFFVFSRFFVGGGKNTGYCRTELMQQIFPELSLGGAMAVSAAAAAPNMGAFTVGPLVILLALLNIRLGYWVPSPKNVRKWLSQAGRSRVRSLLEYLPARLLGRYRVRPGPYLFLRELLSQIDDKGRNVNVSDGGHLENTAIFELLRRRCKVIIAGDAEADAKMNFGGLAVLQRLARIDLSTEIEMDTSDLRHENGKSARHFAVGQITYPETAWAPKETGYLIYLKSTLTGDESQLVLEYAGRRELFPHESTGDQFFDEAQFEAYRDLGSHSVDSLFKELGSPGRDVVAADDWLESWLESAVLESSQPHGTTGAGTMRAQQEAKG